MPGQKLRLVQKTAQILIFAFNHLFYSEVPLQGALIIFSFFAKYDLFTLTIYATHSHNRLTL